MVVRLDFLVDPFVEHACALDYGSLPLSWSSWEWSFLISIVCGRKTQGRAFETQTVLALL